MRSDTKSTATPSSDEQVAMLQPPQAQVEPAGGGGAANAPPGAAKKAATPRKIRYTADVKLIVEEFAKAEQAFKTALKDAQGHVAHSEVSGTTSQGRVGTWKVRVPVEHFESFRDAVRQLGEIERDTADSEDLTEEYYDLESHIKNRQAEETALRNLLVDSGKNLADILLIQEKVNVVHDDINRKQGRLKLMANLTDLTTVTVQLREKQRFNPPPPPLLAEKPSFGERASKSFNDSLETLQAFGEGVALIVITLAPWLPLLLVVALVGWLVLRRFMRLPLVRPQAPAPPTAS